MHFHWFETSHSLVFRVAWRNRILYLPCPCLNSGRLRLLKALFWRKQRNTGDGWPYQAEGRTGRESGCSGVPEDFSGYVFSCIFPSCSIAWWYLRFYKLTAETLAKIKAICSDCWCQVVGIPSRNTKQNGTYSMGARPDFGGLWNNPPAYCKFLLIKLA